jgi:hypothetical protein
MGSEWKASKDPTVKDNPKSNVLSSSRVAKFDQLFHLPLVARRRIRPALADMPLSCRRFPDIRPGEVRAAERVKRNRLPVP